MIFKNANIIKKPERMNHGDTENTEEISKTQISKRKL
jgi:hypothetical protein